MDEAPLEYSAWAPYNDRIRSEFGFPFEREVAAAELLEALLPESARGDPLPRIHSRIAGRTAVVVGLAPRTGPPPLWRLPTEPRPPAVLAADGATATCLDAGLVPDVVVTDLDGPVAAEVAANQRGSLVVIHAHGDNQDALREWVQAFPGEVAGSWAGPPRADLLDVGGFTDGDRAAFLADHAGALRILLWGFDFKRTAPTDPAAHEVKLAKLTWAERLIGILASEGHAPIFTWRPDGSLVRYPPGTYDASTR